MSSFQTRWNEQIFHYNARLGVQAIVWKQHYLLTFGTVCYSLAIRSHFNYYYFSFSKENQFI